MTQAITIDDMLEAIRQDNSIGYLLKFGDIEFVKREVENLDHNVLRNKLLGELEKYLGGREQDQIEAFEEALKGSLSGKLVKRLANLGMVTIAYKALLNDKEAEEIILNYPYLFENRSEEIELFIRNHIITRDLFDNAGDIDFPLAIKQKLEGLKKNTRDNFKVIIDKLVTQLSDYHLYAKQNHKAGNIELGHHQLLPGFRLIDEDSLLLWYSTGGGKTYAAMQAAKTLLQHKPDARILLTTPLPAIEEGTWNEESFSSFGIKNEVAVVRNGNEINNPSILIVNYNKLPSSRKYLEDNKICRKM